MAGFDEKCPYCNTDMKCQSHWDYQEDFRCTCFECEKEVRIRVHSIPSFETMKPTCEKCNRVEIESGYYCKKCQAELDALSKHNADKTKGTT